MPVSLSTRLRYRPQRAFGGKRPVFHSSCCSGSLTTESVLIVARPLAWTIALNVIISALAVAASPVEPLAFLANMPIAPVAIFVLACWLLVRLAYALGERAIFRVPSLTVDVE